MRPLEPLARGRNQLYTHAVAKQGYTILRGAREDGLEDYNESEGSNA